MSRSKRKTPIAPVASPRNGTQKKWKTKCNRKLRRIAADVEFPQGKRYKHLGGDIWDSPADGKYSWNPHPDGEKYLRK